MLSSPGGPGEPGTQALQDEGHIIQDAVDYGDPPNETFSSNDTGSIPKYYDIIAFDPRSVENTSPRLECFPNEFQRGLWRWQSSSEDDLGSSNETFRDKWAKWKAFGTRCTQQAKKEGRDSIAYHMNTTPVTADMIEIIERHGQWREKEARKKILGCLRHARIFTRWNPTLTPEKHSVLARTRWRKGQERIQFWGLSYGTILGQNLATMYPTRIERLILDGVSIAEDHFAGKKFSSLANMDKSFDKFFEYCYEAGPGQCPLWRRHGAAELKQNTMAQLDTLRTRSLPVPGTDTIGPTSIAYSDYKRLIRESLYYPLTKFPKVALYLAQMLKGDGTELARRKLDRQLLLNKAQKCTYKGLSDQRPEQCDLAAKPREESFAGIQCTDFPSIVNETQADFQPYLDELLRQSKIGGDFWAELRMSCIGWDIRPSWRFTGWTNVSPRFPD